MRDFSPDGHFWLPPDVPEPWVSALLSGELLAPFVENLVICKLIWLQEVGTSIAPSSVDVRRKDFL